MLIRFQGGAGPSGCDACHWRNTVLSYGAHSECLKVAVVALASKLTNSFVPWEDIMLQSMHYFQDPFQLTGRTTGNVLSGVIDKNGEYNDLRRM